LKALLGGISLISSNHLDETEATRLLCMRIQHDLALLDITILLEETGYLQLGETRMDTGDEEVRTRVDGAIILGRASLVLGGWTTTIGLAVTVGGCRATSTSSRTLTTGWSRACAAVTLVTGSLLLVAGAVLVLVIHGSHDGRLSDR